MSRISIRGIAAAILIALAPAAAGTGVSARRLPIDVNYADAPILALDRTGSPHVIYTDVDYRLRHAWLEDRAWTEEFVDDIHGYVWEHGAAFDSLGRLHVAVLTLPTASEVDFKPVLAHAIRDSAGWTLRDIEVGAGAACLALDAQDRPHVAFGDAEGHFSIARPEGSDWIVERTGLEGGGRFLTIDQAGTSHALLLRSGSTGDYASNGSGQWSHVPAPMHPPQGALCIDSSGRPHLLGTYATLYPDDRLWHCWRDDDGWICDFPDLLPSEDPFAYRTGPGILADDRGGLVVHFSDLRLDGPRYRSRARLAYFDGRQWRLVPLGSGAVAATRIASRGSFYSLVGNRSWRLVHVTVPDVEAWAEDTTVEMAGNVVSVAGVLRLRNAGARRSGGVRVKFYLSDDDHLTLGDERVGTVLRAGPIHPGADARLDFSFTFEASPGLPRLLAVVDPEGVRQDLDRRNNVAVIPVDE